MSDRQASENGFLQFLDFSRAENRTAGMLAVYHFLAMTSFAAVKPARNALLLDRLGPDFLPIAIVLTAVVTGLVVYLAGWMADRYSGTGPVTMTTITLLVTMLLFRQLFDTAGSWVSLAFYVFVQLFSNVLLTQFWLVAGDQFTPRDAKRLFGLVGAGGVVGGIVGPAVAFRVVDQIGTPDLLYVSAGFLICALPMVRYFERRRRPAASSDTTTDTNGSGLQLFREFRHVKLIGLILGASYIAQTILDFQFQTIVSSAFGSADSKTSFFAKFFALQNLAGLFIHLLLTRYFLMRFGVGVSLLLLPAALGAGAVGVLVNPVLWVAALAKFSEGGIRYSLNEATREVLYLPLPSQVRSRVRPLIDMFGMRVFDGLAGLLIILSTSVLGLSLRALSIVSLVTIAGWLVAVVAVKREYLKAIRELFTDVSPEANIRVAEVLDDETVSFFVERLQSPDVVQAQSALALLDLMHDKQDVIVPLRQALRTHPSASVRAGALEQLLQAGSDDCQPEAMKLLGEPDPAARLSAVRYLCRYGRPDVAGTLQALRSDPDARVRIAAIGAVERKTADGQDQVRAALDEVWGSPGEVEGLVEGAHLLGTLDDHAYDDILLRILQHGSPAVVRAGLEAAAATGRRVFLPWVIPAAGDGTLALFAQRALRAYGDRVIHTLRDYIEDPEEPAALRAGIPACYAAIGTERAAACLLDLLETHGEAFGAEIVDALVEIRSRQTISCDADSVNRILRARTSREEEAAATPVDLRVVMGLLSLIYPADDVNRAHAGLRSGERELRSNAIELLDNLLEGEHKRRVLPYIEAVTA